MGHGWRAGRVCAPSWRQRCGTWSEPRPAGGGEGGVRASSAGGGGPPLLTRRAPRLCVDPQILRLNLARVRQVHVAVEDRGVCLDKLGHARRGEAGRGGHRALDDERKGGGGGEGQHCKLHREPATCKGAEKCRDDRYIKKETEARVSEIIHPIPPLGCLFSFFLFSSIATTSLSISQSRQSKPRRAGLGGRPRSSTRCCGRARWLRRLRA